MPDLTVPQLDMLAVLAEQRWDLVQSFSIDGTLVYFWQRYEDGSQRYADSLTVRALMARGLIRWRRTRPREWVNHVAVITFEGRRVLRDSKHPAPAEPRFRPRIAR